MSAWWTALAVEEDPKGIGIWTLLVEAGERGWGRGGGGRHGIYGIPVGPATIHDGEPPVEEERSWAGAWNRMTRRDLLVGCVTARTICLHAIILHKDGMALSLTHNQVLHQALARPLHERRGQCVVEDTTPGPVIPRAPSSLNTESCAYGHPTAPSARPGVCGRAMYRGGEPRSKDGKEGTGTATGSRAETGMRPERGGHGNGADTGTGVDTRG